MFIDKETKLRVNINAPYKGHSSLVDFKVREAVGVIEIPEPLAPEDFDAELYYVQEIDQSPYTLYTRKSDEQIAANQLHKAKNLRKQAVDSIIVTTSSGKQFDGHEDAQNRMSRTLNLIQEGEVTEWVLADNSIALVTKEELSEALRLAGLEQTKLWIKPYQGEEHGTN